MALSSETNTFLTFVLIGILFSFIYDIFRAFRRVKKVSTFSIYIQDIAYFIIIGVILLIAIINVLNSEIRLYVFIAIILGVSIYISIIGNTIRNIFSNIFRFSNNIIDFILIPISIYTTIFSKQIIILKKFVINCCKKISYMINFKCVKTKFLNLKKKIKTKEDYLNDKKRKSNC